MTKITGDRALAKGHRIGANGYILPMDRPRAHLRCGLQGGDGSSFRTGGYG
jgi:hypothetical protein